MAVPGERMSKSEVRRALADMLDMEVMVVVAYDGVPVEVMLFGDLNEVLEHIMAGGFTDAYKLVARTNPDLYITLSLHLLQKAAEVEPGAMVVHRPVTDSLCFFTFGTRNDLKAAKKGEMSGPKFGKQAEKNDAAKAAAKAPAKAPNGNGKKTTTTKKPTTSKSAAKRKTTKATSVKKTTAKRTGGAAPKSTAKKATTTASRRRKARR